MAKSTKTRHPSARWENSLPASYTPLIHGFSVNLTVGQLARMFDSSIKPPKDIRDIPIGCFTPDLFNDEDFQNFWKSPVVIKKPNQATHAVMHVLATDPDIRAVQQRQGFAMDHHNPTFETFARLAQTLEIGCKSRLSELVHKNLLDRIDDLRNPVIYQAMLNSDYVQKNRLRHMLPDQCPDFFVKRGETNIKTINSALDKAYGRTGRPDSKEKFLAEPEKYGIFAVNDHVRTTLRLNRSDRDIDTANMLNNYVNLRNVLIIAVKSGALGMVPTEITDSVLYPSGDRASDHYPVGMVKGEMYHAGPDNTYLKVASELQIQVLPDHAVEASHIMYQASRDHKRTADEIQASGTTDPFQIELMNEARERQHGMDEERKALFRRHLPQEINEIRDRFIESGKDKNVAPRTLLGDTLGAYVVAKDDILRDKKAAHVRALLIAHHENKDKHNFNRSEPVALTTGSNDPVSKRALALMIQQSDIYSQPTTDMQTTPVHAKLRIEKAALTT